MRNWGIDMAPELRVFEDGSTFEFVSPIDMAWQLGIKPPCPSCRRVTRLQNAHGGLMPRCHAISIGDTNSNVARSSILEPGTDSD